MDNVAKISGHSLITLSLSTTAAQTNQLVGGLYDVFCDVPCYIKVGGDASSVTVNNGYPIVVVDQAITIEIPQGQRLGGIVASSTGTLKLHKVG